MSSDFIINSILFPDFIYCIEPFHINTGSIMGKSAFYAYDVRKNEMKFTRLCVRKGTHILFNRPLVSFDATLRICSFCKS